MVHSATTASILLLREAKLGADKSVFINLVRAMSVLPCRWRKLRGPTRLIEDSLPGRLKLHGKIVLAVQATEKGEATLASGATW